MLTLLAVMSLNTNGLLGLIVLILDIVALVSLLMGRGSLGHKLLWCVLIVLLPVSVVSVFVTIEDQVRRLVEFCNTTNCPTRPFTPIRY